MRQHDVVQVLLEEAESTANANIDATLARLLQRLDNPRQGHCLKCGPMLADYVRAAIARTKHRREDREDGYPPGTSLAGREHEAEYQLRKLYYHDEECTCAYTEEAWNRLYREEACLMQNKPTY